MALKYAIVLDRHPEYGVKALPIDLNPETVPPDKLAWSHVFSGPNERGRNYVPEIGQPVLIEDNHFVAGPAGSNFHPVVAVLNPSINQQGGLPGNLDLMRSFQEFLKSTKNNILKPSSVQEEGKPTIRKRIPADDYNFAQTKGMPSHTTIAQTFGMVLPQVKNISTAVDQFSGVLNAGILGSLPGISLGNIVNMISSNPIFQQALGELAPEVQQAFTAISTFSRSVQGGGGYGYSLGNRVNEQTLINNALRLVKEVKDVSDLYKVLQDLQSDTSLHGCETLEDTVIYVNNVNTADSNIANISFVEIETEDANAANVIAVTVDANTLISNTKTNSTITITSCGKVQQEDGSDVLDAIKNVMSLLNTFASISSPSAGLGIGGVNNVAKKWADAQSRLPPQVQQMRQKLLKDISVAGGNLSNLAIAAQVAKRVYKLIP